MFSLYFVTTFILGINMMMSLPGKLCREAVTKQNKHSGRNCPLSMLGSRGTSSLHRAFFKLLGFVISLFFVVCLLIWDKLSLCSPIWPETESGLLASHFLGSGNKDMWRHARLNYVFGWLFFKVYIWSPDWLHVLLKPRSANSVVLS